MPRSRVAWAAQAFATERGKKILAALGDPSLNTEAERKLVFELNEIIVNLARHDVHPLVAKAVGTIAAAFSAAMEGKAQ